MKDLPMELSSCDYHQDLTYSGLDFSSAVLRDHVFDTCTFQHCTFSGTDISSSTFQNCLVEDSGLILCRVEDTTLDSVRFRYCRLTGMNFTDCSEFGFAPDFDECLLDSCVFYDNDLRGRNFLKTTLRNTDFSNCRMQKAVFDDTRFQSSSFLGCNLEKADFRRAVGYAIDPTANKLKGALFSLPEAGSFLKYLGITIE